MIGAITKDPNILGGEPVFRGTRVPFKVLLDYLEGGDTLDQFDECAPKSVKDLSFKTGARVSHRSGGRLVWNAERRTLDSRGNGFRCARYRRYKPPLPAELGWAQDAIIILQSSSNRLDHLLQFFPDCLSALNEIKPGEIAVIGPAAWASNLTATCRLVSNQKR